MGTVDETRRTNLTHLAAEAGGVAALAARVGVSASQISQWMHGAADSKTGKPRGMWPASCRKVEAAMHKPEGWLDRQHPFAGEEPAPYKVAQDLSHAPAFDAIPVLAWEALMTDPTPTVFRTTLPDDALAPEHPAGAELVWSTQRRLMPGRLVLVRDARGHVYARRCQQGSEPGRWLAAATNASYLTLDSAEHALTVLAVYKGRLEPDDL